MTIQRVQVYVCVNVCVYVYVSVSGYLCVFHVQTNVKTECSHSAIRFNYKIVVTITKSLCLSSSSSTFHRFYSHSVEILNYLGVINKKKPT